MAGRKLGPAPCLWRPTWRCAMRFSPRFLKRTRKSRTMTDILTKIVGVKREEVAAAIKRKPLSAMRADAENFDKIINRSLRQVCYI
jgi:hypothetical protein